jgi:hypothetical protein
MFPLPNEQLRARANFILLLTVIWTATVYT